MKPIPLEEQAARQREIIDKARAQNIKHQPATPLPHVAEHLHIVARDAEGKLRGNVDDNHGDPVHCSVAVFYGPDAKANVAFYRHAGEAYAKLVAALNKAIAADAAENLDDLLGAMTAARALLRDLGEAQ